MARVLIVGCGCRGRQLAAALIEDGHVVRGTTRSGDHVDAIESTGAEAVVADPDRLGTLMPALAGVSVVCWLMGTATGSPDAVAALHGPRLQSMVEALVDTPVRGLVYEAAGTVAQRVLEQGAGIADRTAATYRMPLRLVDRPPADVAGWTAAMRAAVGGILDG